MGLSFLRESGLVRGDRATRGRETLSHSIMRWKFEAEQNVFIDLRKKMHPLPTAE
jgi:hypothetical protein